MKLYHINAFDNVVGFNNNDITCNDTIFSCDQFAFVFVLLNDSKQGNGIH